VIGPWNALSALREVVDLHERTSADVMAMLATRLEGQRLSLPVDGRRLEGLVHWIGVQGSAEPHQIRIVLREVDYDGWRLDPVAIAADEVRMGASPAANLTAFGLRIDGRAPLRSLMARLNRQLKDWSLAVGPDGRVEARNVRCPELRLTVEPTVQDHRVDVELCGVRWRRVHLNLPTWLRLRRIVELPPLPLGVVVVDARRRGDAVDLRLTVPSVSKKLSQPLLQARHRSAGASENGRGGFRTCDSRV
jgi:hypothetical protein